MKIDNAINDGDDTSAATAPNPGMPSSGAPTDPPVGESSPGASDINENDDGIQTDYVSALGDVPSEYARGFQNLGVALSRQGVSDGSVISTLQWVQMTPHLGELPPGSEVRRDGYRNIDLDGFDAREIPGAIHFVNYMAEQGEPEHVVRAALDVYRQIRGLAAQHAVQSRAMPHYRTSGDARIGEIEHILRTDRRRYDRDQGMQSEYLQLLRARGR